MPNKPGYKTTEFWLVVIAAVSVWVDAVPLPADFEGFVIPTLAAVYAISRGLAKISPGAPQYTDDKYTDTPPLVDSPDANV